MESRPTVGSREAEHLGGERLAHHGELTQMLGPHIGVGAHVEEDDRQRAWTACSVQMAGRLTPLMRRT